MGHLNKIITFSFYLEHNFQPLFGRKRKVDGCSVHEKWNRQVLEKKRTKVSINYCFGSMINNFSHRLVPYRKTKS